MRNNALYRLWGITGESVALLVVSLRWLWVYPSVLDVRIICELILMMTLSLLILFRKDPTTLLLCAAAAGINTVLLPWLAVVFLPCVMVLVSFGNIRLNAYASAMGRFLLGSGKLACIGIAIAAGTGFIIAFLPTTWVLPLTAGLLLLSGLRFPVKPLHLHRLAAYDRRLKGENMEALHAQLDTYLHCRRKRRRLFSILMIVVRLFHHCKVEGIENLPPKPERLIFLCNHFFKLSSGYPDTWHYLVIPDSATIRHHGSNSNFRISWMPNFACYQNMYITMEFLSDRQGYYNTPTWYS
jgi:hypothetical protein